VRRQHLYLPGERRGIFNPNAARNADEIILTESVIDAAALWSVGLRGAIPTYGTTGLTDEIINHLVASRVRRDVLLMDADKAGRAAAEEMKARLEKANIAARRGELTNAKDAAEFVASGGKLEDVRSVVAPETTESEQSTDEPATSEAVTDEPTNEPSEAAPTIETGADGALVFRFSNREYRVRGLSPVGLDRLKINLRLSVENSFHLDTLDLYQARVRALFAHTAARACNAPEQIINADLLTIVEKLEAVRLEMRNKKLFENQLSFNLRNIKRVIAR